MSLDNQNDVILSDEELLRVSTDLDDYAPGSTAIITAEGVDVGGSVTFEVEHVSDAGEDGIYGTADDTTVDLGGDGHDSWTVTDGGAGDLDGEANGVIVTAWYVNPDDSLDETFLLSADDGSDTAFWSFTDGLFVNPDTGHAAPVGADGPTEVDLTAKDSPTYEEIESGTVWTNDVFGAGTGVIDPFLRIQSNGTEDGVNTSGKNALNNDEKAQANGYTRDLLLNEIALFTSQTNDPTNGVAVLNSYADVGQYFFEFRLDINENSNSNGDQYISLDEMMIFISTDDHLTIESTQVYGSSATDIAGLFYDSDLGNSNATAAPSNLALVYDLDGSSQGDTWVALNYDLRAGSGVGDIAVYIEQQDFNAQLGALGLTPADYDQVYVYLVTAMGNQGDGLAPLLTDSSDSDLNDTYAPGTDTEDAKWQSSDGFEEWSILKGGTPVGAIEGYKIHDYDADGTQDAGDTGIGDWKIYLYVDDGNGTFGAEDLENLDGVAEGTGGVLQYDNADFMTQTVNSGDMIGYYSFAGLDANLDYWIVEANDKIGETGWLNSQDITQTINGFDYVVLGLVDLTGGQIYGDDDTEATDFLNYKLGSISGTKYLDENGDGTRQETETTGVAGITIRLLDSEGGLVATTTTDADGNWSFDNLEPGTYSVEEVLTASGYVTKAETIHEDIVVTSGDVEDGYEFLNYRLGQISGRKYEDEDGDGAGGTDTNKTGWTIYLYRDNGDGEFTEADGDPIASTTTDASGYSFTGLEMGTYFVVEEDRDGWVATTPVMVEVDGTSSGFNAQNVDFYNFETFSISGTKYHDRNADGVIDAGDDTWGDDANEGEVTIFIDALTPNGVLDQAEIDAGYTATVGTDGTWSISGLDWTVDGANVYEILPDGTYQSLGPVAGVDTIDATSGNDQTGFDFANYLLGRIEGTKYYDNEYGDDIPLAGWRVDLYDSDGVLVGTDFTDAEGNYAFDDLTPGTYTVEESVPDGWSATGGVTTHEVTVASGETVDVNTDQDPTDFRNSSSVDIGGEKREDDDADGDFGDSDTGLPGWTINIYLDDGDGTFGAEDGPAYTSALTDGSGAWTATLSDIGTYFVEEVDKDGWTQSSAPAYYTVTVSYDSDIDNDGNGVDGTFDPGLVAVESGGAGTDALDFLNYQKGSITGEKYYGGTDYALVGWEVALFAADADPETDDPITTTLTGAGGVYSFGGLEPGDYLVVESVPDGWDAYDGGPTQHLVTVASGEAVGVDSDATDFRNISEIEIGGTKYEDANADGSIAGDSALTDVSFDIQIWKDGQAEGLAGHGEIGTGDTLITTVSTDGSGNWSYTLEDLGSYIVRELVPAGWTQSYPAGDTYSFDVVYDPDLDDLPGTFDPGLVIEGVSDKDDLDFANWAPGKIEGYKWEDADGSDDTTDDRTGVEGWKITLTGDADGDGDQDELVAYTDSTGYYSFADLFPGDYVLTEESKTGWFNVTPVTIDVNGLTSRETDSDNDFVNTRYGRIDGYKYVDDDGDLGTGDDQSAKAGWTISLLDSDGAEIASTTTDVNGYYAFENLVPGTYTVKEESPDGWINLTEVEVTLSDLESGFDEEVSFINFEKFSIEGRKYEDLTGDGLSTDDQYWSGAEGVTIYIDENGNNELDDGERSVVTGTDGYYRFDDLTLEDLAYQVREVEPAGTTQTGTEEYQIQNPGSGGTGSGYDFTNFIDFDLNGQKVIDLNGNGEIDQEEINAAAAQGPVGSNDEVLFVRMGLYVVTNPGPGETLELIDQTDTDITGAFSFSGLGPLEANQEYRVLEIGYYTTYIAPGDPGNVLVLIDAAESNYVVVEEPDDIAPVSGGGQAGEGEIQYVLNFEDFKVTGTKYEDLTGDGLTEDDDPWSHGPVRIFIDDNENGAFDWTDTPGDENGMWDPGEGDRWVWTGENGYYEFTGLSRDDFGLLIYEQAPDGSVSTGPVSQVIEQTGSGGEDSDNDFANFRLARIEGYKFWDLNRDGLWDQDDSDGSVETGAEGWEIELYRESGDADGLDALDEDLGSTFSDADGAWGFDGLMAGTYYVKEVLQPGYVQTTPDYLGDGIFKVVVDTSGEVVTVDVNGDDLLFGNDQIDGPGVRTPGFWQSPLGGTFRDGDPDNDGVLQYNEDDTPAQDEKTGDEFAEDDVFWLKYESYMSGGTYPLGDDGKPILLVGDWDWDTEDNDAEPHPEGLDGVRGYDFDEATLVLQGGDGTGSKGKNADYAKVAIVERSLVAAWLNYMAGNPVDSPLEGEDVAYWIDQAIQYVNDAPDGRKAAKDAWSQGFDDVEAGSDIQTALDGWNNWGWDGDSASYVAFDGDNGLTVTAQSYYDAVDHALA